METPDTNVFERPASAVVAAYWQLAAAGGLVLFSIVNFLVTLRINVSMVNLQMTTTAPMLGAFFSWCAACCSPQWVWRTHGSP